MRDAYDVDNDGEIFTEKEIVTILSNHYLFYKNMPWLMRLYYKPWIVLLDSLIMYLAPTFTVRMNESIGALDEVNKILKESYDEDSNS